MIRGLETASALDRRALLGAAAAGLGWLAGCTGSEPAAGADPSGGTPPAQSGGRRVDPVELAVVAAPEDQMASMPVPTPGTVTLVDLFATWCGPCVEQLERLRTVHDAVGDRARFVSVTNEAFGGEFTRADLRSWWAGHGGPWPVAHDAEGRLLFRLDATGIPHTAVVDPRGRVTWAHRGLTDPTVVIDQIAAATSDG